MKDRENEFTVGDGGDDFLPHCYQPRDHYFKHLHQSDEVLQVAAQAVKLSDHQIFAPAQVTERFVQPGALSFASGGFLQRSSRVP